MRDFLQSGGWFEKKYRDHSSGRWPTFKAAINFFLQRHGHTIVELGTTKTEEDWGAGMSTLLFAEVVGKYGGKIYTVDNYPPHIENCKRITKEWKNYITHVESDSLEFLENFRDYEDGEIDLFYPDTLDYPLTPEEGDPKECQEYQLKEVEAAYPYLSKKATILLDDNEVMDFGKGKTKLAKDFLFKKKWHLVLDGQQSLWVRG